MNAKELAAKGRGGDTQLAHVMEGETLVPPGVLTPEVQALLYQQMIDAGIDPASHTVGEGMSINPETGLPEFGFGKSFRKAFKSVSKIVLPNLGFAGGFADGLIQGDGLGGALKGGLQSGINTAISLAAPTVLSGLSDTLVGRSIGDIGSYLSKSASGALSDFGNFTGLGDIYNSASGALSNLGKGADSLYQGSDLQSAFKSGGDALKSIGLGTGTGTGAAASPIGGGASSYGGTDTNFLGNNFSLNNPNLGETALDGASTGATQVASNSSISPILSALLGSRANSQAEEALLKGQRANQALLQPYANGFSFTPGDLTQDPGYQFNLAEGTKAADRAQLARGGYFSGEAAKELSQFNQGLADNTYNTAFNRALQGRQAGLTGALANAGVNTDIGDIKANSATNQGNLYSGALGNLLGGSSFTNTGALQGGFDIQSLLRDMELRRQGVSSYAGA